MPEGKTVVLGLVSTKTGQLEDADEIKRRIDEAGAFVDFDRLALSPQCGFSSTHHGNDITYDEQMAKLELVVSSPARCGAETVPSAPGGQPGPDPQPAT